MFKTFKGGMHIPDHKEETNKIPVRKAEGAPIHIFPLQQHIGVMLDLKVNIGDYVKVGQVMADSDAFLSVPLHSSVSGTVTEIKPHLHPSGAEVTSIFVENDFKYTICDDVCPKNVDAMSKKEIVNVIRNAGIVGMGGAGFPTHVKLSPPEGKKVTHIIMNAAECEPYLTSDHRRLLEQTEDVVLGMRICMKLFDLSKGHIGIEANKPDAADAIRALKDDRIEVVMLKTKYPQGSEKQLIKAVTGKKVPAGGLPVDVGAIVINVDTAFEIAQAFKTGMPVTKRIITVAGDCVKNPCNLEVMLGTPFEFVINQAGGLEGEPKKILMGGPMMGMAQYSLSVPTVKTTSAILALLEAAEIYDAGSPCIRCGKCVKYCPMNLMPLYLGKYAAQGDLEMCEKYHIMSCVECGLCSYLCPGRRSPVQNIRVAKQKIAEKRRNKK